MPEQISVSEFARREGCNEKQVRRAVEKGIFSKNADGRLDAALVGSGWRKQNRRSILSDVRTKQKSPKVVRESPKEPDADETPEEAAERIMAASGAPHDMAEALRLKENYLALLRQLEYEQKSGALIEMAVAEATFFDVFRAQRDSWLNWPTRIGPLIAAELGIEADRATEILTTHVHKHIAQLGEPEADFGGR